MSAAAAAKQKFAEEQKLLALRHQETVDVRIVALLGGLSGFISGEMMGKAISKHSRFAPASMGAGAFRISAPGGFGLWGAGLGALATTVFAAQQAEAEGGSASGQHLR